MHGFEKAIKILIFRRLPEVPELPAHVLEETVEEKDSYRGQQE
jgi:hypothetical protein